MSNFMKSSEIGKLLVMEEAWPLCLSVLIKEAWPLRVSVAAKKTVFEEVWLLLLSV